MIGPLFGGRGLEFGGGAANSVMYLLFVAAVVAVLVAMALVFVGALRRTRAAGDADHGSARVRVPPPAGATEQERPARRS